MLMYTICLTCQVVANLKQTIEQKNKTLHEKNRTIKKLKHTIVVHLKYRQLDLFNCSYN